MLKVAIVAILFLAGCRLEAEEMTSLQFRLHKASHLLRTASDSGSAEGIRYAAREIANVFFDDELVISRVQTEKLKNQFMSFLDHDGSDLSAISLETVVDALRLKGREIESLDSYVKTSWRRALVFSLALNSIIHLVDLRSKRLRTAIKRLGARGRMVSGQCRWRVVSLAVRPVSHLIHARPRFVQYAAGVATVGYVSNRTFFSHYENWDASEEVVESHILPLLQEMISRKTK